MITKDLGMVTAYAYAVSKGYTGTEEKFAELMASYASVAQEAVDAALAAAHSAQAAEFARDTAQSTVAGAIAGIQAEGQTQVGNVNAAGATQVGNVNTAGSTQVSAVQAKGEEVIASIPDDYTSLSDEIDSLWDAMSFDMTLPTIMANLRHGRVDKVPLGATFTVQHAVYGDITFAVRARNMHKCADDETKPTLTIQPIYLLSNNGSSSTATFQFDRAEAFCKVAEDIPAGTVCKFTTITYGSWLAGTYMFTATSAIPAGSKLCISGTQNTALTSLKVRVYANAKATSHSAEYAISAEDGTATLDLGTWGTDCNHPQRVSYGSNNEAQSNIFQWLNANTGSNNMDSVFVEQTDFDMMDTSFTSKKGFLGGFGAEFRSYLGLAKIPNITNSVFESDPYVKNEAYTHQGYFFLPSRKEIYGSNENAYEADESQFDFYKDVMTADADKLMFARGATSPTSYWLRTPSAGDAYAVRICYAGVGGALSGANAVISIAVAPLAILA